MNETSKRTWVIWIICILVGIAILLYFIVPKFVPSDKIPDYIVGDRRMMYEWAKISPGKDVLQNIPCYCGCKFGGHKNAYNCFWTDAGKFDEHSSTCSVCFDIAMKSKQLYEDGKSICEIRKAVDDFYAENKDLATDTPMPEGCE